jgi:hypothetical protein
VQIPPPLRRSLFVSLYGTTRRSAPCDRGELRNVVIPALTSLAFRPNRVTSTAAPRPGARSILVFFRGSADLHEPMAAADWLRARLLATLR